MRASLLELDGELEIKFENILLKVFWARHLSFSFLDDYMPTKLYSFWLWGLRPAHWPSCFWAHFWEAAWPSFLFPCELTCCPLALEPGWNCHIHLRGSMWPSSHTWECSLWAKHGGPLYRKYVLCCGEQLRVISVHKHSHFLWKWCISMLAGRSAALSGWTAARCESPSRSTLWQFANYFYNARSAIKVDFLLCSFSTTVRQDRPFFKWVEAPSLPGLGGPEHWPSCFLFLSLCIFLSHVWVFILHGVGRCFLVS